MCPACLSLSDPARGLSRQASLRALPHPADELQRKAAPSRQREDLSRMLHEGSEATVCRGCRCRSSPLTQAQSRIRSRSAVCCHCCCCCFLFSFSSTPIRSLSLVDASMSHHSWQSPQSHAGPLLARSSRFWRATRMGGEARRLLAACDAQAAAVFVPRRPSSEAPRWNRTAGSRTPRLTGIRLQRSDSADGRCEGAAYLLHRSLLLSHAAALPPSLLSAIPRSSFRGTDRVRPGSSQHARSQYAAE